MALFPLHHLAPGGPYLLEVIAPGFMAVKKSNLFVELGDPFMIDLVAETKEVYLGNVTVSNTSWKKTGTESFIDADRMAAIPAAGRQLHDYLRTVPQARLMTGNEGAVSVAGQNNRYNAFYIDGAVSNDVFGLSASGTQGGQAGISPVALEAVNQLQINISPFDVSMGNFTGAGINAVTRSGTNKTEGAVYYYFSNAALVGKTKGMPKESADGFFTRNFGGRMQGALVQNKCFYFVNIDLQKEEHPQHFDFSNYTGNTKTPATLSILANSLQSNYHYDPGSLLNNPKSISAARMTIRFDWNTGNHHKIAFSYRHTDAARVNTNSSTSELLSFSRSGYYLSARTRSASLELKSTAGRNTANQLLITYTRVSDNRDPLEQPFPRVRIQDGNGAIVFGTDASSTTNLLTQGNWTLLDRFMYTKATHRISAGIDCEYNSIYNSFVQNSFGYYTYASIGDFITNDRPSFYQSGYSLRDNPRSEYSLSAARFRTAKASFFLNDRYRPFRSLTLTVGLRIDRYYFLTRPVSHDSFNRFVLPQLSAHWNLEEAQTGHPIIVPATISPRLGFAWQGARRKLTIHGGAGIFTGRIPLAWAGNTYLNNGTGIGGYVAAAAQLNRMRFRADPYRAWKAADLGVPDNRIPIDLITPRLAMPKMIRLLLGLEWQVKNWWFSAAGLLTTQLTEISYRNVNLLPPVDHALGPDNRKVYPIVNNGKIPLLADGSNPYEPVILLGNYTGKKGYSSNYTFSVKTRPEENTRVEMNYYFCRSFAVNDGTSSVSMSQWRFTETVNGRNDISLSRSDFSSGHRVIVLLSRRIPGAGKKITNSVSVLYTGESGQPFSYVYGLSGMVRDDGTQGGNDLIYVPSSRELEASTFLPYASGNQVFTPEQQKQALDKYLEGNAYLRSRRGQYAERNGSRAPFTHIVDLKLKSEWKLKLFRDRYRCQLTLDIYNLGNLLHREWGLRYTRQNDNLPLIRFAGYASETNLTPRYQFDPDLLQSGSFEINDSFTPAYASKWMAQLGIVVIF